MEFQANPEFLCNPFPTSQEMERNAVISKMGENSARKIGMKQGVKKKFVVMLYGDRTVNRHRWMRRES